MSFDLEPDLDNANVGKYFNCEVNHMIKTNQGIYAWRRRMSLDFLYLTKRGEESVWITQHRWMPRKKGLSQRR